MDKSSIKKINNHTTAFQQGFNSYIDALDEAIFYLVIDKKKQKLIDTS